MNECVDEGIVASSSSSSSSSREGGAWTAQRRGWCGARRSNPSVDANAEDSVARRGARARGAVVLRLERTKGRGAVRCGAVAVVFEGREDARRWTMAKRSESDGSVATASVTSGMDEFARGSDAEKMGKADKLCVKFFSIHGCAYGDECHYLHTYRPGLPVPARPAPLPYVYATSAHGSTQMNEKMKTRLCRNFQSAEGCRFGDRCSFAHGEGELRSDDLNGDGTMDNFGMQQGFGKAVLVPVPQSQVGAIVGKAGSSIAQVSAATGAKVSMLSAEYTNSDGDRLCRLVGSPFDVERAKELICHRLAVGKVKKRDTKPSRTFKTKICALWQKDGSCKYGDKCHFAHGTAELHKVDATEVA